MNKFFYTFSSDPQFPYKNGWIEVHAETLEEEHEKFRSRFPDRHNGIDNCASFYREARWHEINPECNWPGYRCCAIIE